MTAWTTADLKVDRRWSHALTSQKPSGLVEDSSQLWVCNGNNLAAWTLPDADKPEPVQSPSNPDEPTRLLAIKGEIYGVIPPGIIAIRAHKLFPVPELGGQLKIKYLSILTVAQSGDDIWIGTGNNEWGGHLVKFDTKNGQWESYYDSLHYVTGIAPDPTGKIWVSWSMSHFSASTVIRIHGAETKPVWTGKELEGHYFQALTYSEFDHAIYGVEQSNLGVINDQGELTSPINLGKVQYPRENKAIGVRPGVVRIIPLGPGCLVVVFNYGEPVMVRNGKPVRFEAPASPLTPSSRAS